MTCRPSIDADEVRDALDDAGEVLKDSYRSRTSRVGAWVIKKSRWDGGRALIRHTLRRNHRRAWEAAVYLLKSEVNVPAPYALVEHSVAGICWGSAFVSEYLDGFHNVEDHARKIAAGNVHPNEVHGFLGALARAVNGLNETGAYHGDLSGKNIFTRNGASFYFLDFDAVELGVEYSNERRMKNHIQLYDSFCDLWDDDFLEPFILAMMPGGYVPPTWMQNVKVGQRARRERTEAIWERQRHQAS